MARAPWFPALEESRTAMVNARAMLRGLQSDVAHHTDLSPELDALSSAISRASSVLYEPSRCPRCEGYEATHHTFEGECSEATNSQQEPKA